MAKTFSDFGGLSELKKLLGKEEAAGGSSPLSANAQTADSSGVLAGDAPASRQVQKPRPRIVVNRSRAEHLAAKDGISRGTRVRMMDTNDVGVIAGFGDGWFEIESDGLVFRAMRCEFVVADAGEDMMLRNAIPSRKKKGEEKKKTAELPSEISVDLHLDRIPGSDGVPAWAALDFQMNYFRQVLRQNMKYKGRRIRFIHGVGDGVLAASVRRELDESFAVSCVYTYGEPGVTMVTVK
ncbi:MAG: hypothetical protein NC308_02160 [Clostridium sp.]|nr:hypothetical protein [Bacteroides sp.]MCM1197668.1 hypothetical protein [Clostridium sp.]